MEKKAKIAAIAAAGALVIFIGAGVARCAMQSPESPADEPAIVEAVSSEDARPEEATDDAVDSDQDAPRDEAAFSNYANTSWTSVGGSTLALVDGAMVERAAEGTGTVFYYTVSREQAVNDGRILAIISVSSNLGSEPADTTVVIEKTGDVVTLSCDVLSATYVLDTQTDSKVELVGAGDELYGIFNKTEADFEEAIDTYAQSHFLHASKATWSKEVWIDYGSRTYLTNFTLNDASATIVTISADDTGVLEAL